MLGDIRSNIIHYQVCEDDSEFFSMCSNFTENDGGSGGAVSMTYFPSRFDGINVFQRNRGRSVVVRNKVCVMMIMRG